MLIGTNWELLQVPGQLVLDSKPNIMNPLFILLLTLPEGVFCSCFCQLSFTSASGLLKRCDVDVILPKLSGNEGRSSSREVSDYVR